MTPNTNDVLRRVTLKQAAVACGGVSAALLCVGWLGSATSLILVLGSFGSSCVLLFACPDSMFSQPRNFIAGHFLSTLVGLLFYHFVGPQWWAMALAAGAASAVMMLTGTLHPPAGSNPLIVYLVRPDWQFLWFPTLAGAIVVQAVAVLYHRATRPAAQGTSYPRYWFTPAAVTGRIPAPPAPGNPEPVRQ